MFLRQGTLGSSDLDSSSYQSLSDFGCSSRSSPAHNNKGYSPRRFTDYYNPGSAGRRSSSSSGHFSSSTRWGSVPRGGVAYAQDEFSHVGSYGADTMIAYRHHKATSKERILPRPLATTQPMTDTELQIMEQRSYSLSSAINNFLQRSDHTLDEWKSSCELKAARLRRARSQLGDSTYSVGEGSEYDITESLPVDSSTTTTLNGKHQKVNRPKTITRRANTRSDRKKRDCI